MSFAKFIQKFTQAFLILLVGSAAVPSSWTQTYSVLYSFTGGTDGGFPEAGLIQDSAGNLYGTTGESVFKLNRKASSRCSTTLELAEHRSMQVWSGTQPATSTAPLF